MTGNQLANTSSFTGAANKIVEFNRQNVSPLSSNINNLVSNISTNILNKVDNSIQNTTNFIRSENQNELVKLEKDIYSQISQIQSEISDLQLNLSNANQIQPKTPVNQIQQIVQNIQTQAQTVLDNTLKGFSQDYQEKVKGFDDTRPNNVLSEFLNLYRNAIGFVNFFGDKKNIKTVETNLKALRIMFEESFEVATILRQTIVKIVNQLSNLPTASPSSGGLNLDIDVPGGRLRQAGGPAVRNVGRVAKMGGIAGAGLLGLGGLSQISGGMGRAKQYQEELLSTGVSPVSGEQYIPENIIEGFSSIIDRFVSAINTLITGAKKSSQSGGDGGGTTSSGGGGEKIGDVGQSSYLPGNIPESVKSDVPFTSGVTELAKKYNIPENYLYAVMGFETGGSFSPSETNKRGSGATGLIQFMPETAKGLGTTTEALSRMNRAEQLKYVDKYFEGNLPKGASLSDVYMSILMPAAVGKPDNTVLFGPGGIIPNGYSQNSGLDLNGDGKVTKAEASSKVLQYLPKNSSNKTQVSPAPTQTQATQARATAISQSAQKTPTTISLPPTIIDAGGSSNVASSRGGGLRETSQPQGNGPQVPLLASANSDNMFTMFSRMTYGIVDG